MFFIIGLLLSQTLPDFNKMAFTCVYFIEFCSTTLAPFIYR